MLIVLSSLWPNKVPFHIDGGQPSYLIIAGLVFTPLSEPLIEYVTLISGTEYIILVINFLC